MHLATPFIAGPLCLLIAGLGIAISLRRRAGKTSDPSFPRLVRIHGNLVEHAPIVVILLFILEALAAPRALILGIGAAFVVARISQALGMTKDGANPLRFFGATMTYVVEVALGVLVIVYAL